MMMTRLLIRKFTLPFANGWRRKLGPLWLRRQGGDDHDDDDDDDDDDDAADDGDNDHDDHDDYDDFYDDDILCQDSLWRHSDNGVEKTTMMMMIGMTTIMMMMIMMMMLMMSMMTMFCARILYGGSVTAANCRELAACPDIDGNPLLSLS